MQPTSRALVVVALLTTVFLSTGLRAQSIGRLFTTPDERRLLDQLRIETELAPKPEPVSAKPQGPAPPVVNELTINGIVKRSSGRNSTWINGSPVTEDGVTREGVRVDAGGPGSDRLRIRLPSGVDTIELKPGQKIEIVSGRVLEAFEYEATDSAASAFESESLEKLMGREDAERDGTVPPAPGAAIVPGPATTGVTPAPAPAPATGAARAAVPAAASPAPPGGG